MDGPMSWAAGHGLTVREGKRNHDSMTTYALVHGAGDVGWYWHLVELLESYRS